VVRETDFQVLFLANVVAPLGAAVITPLLDSLTGPLGATPANVGLLMSAFTAPPIVLIPLVGLLSDRYGRKPLIVVGLLLFGAGGSAIFLADTFRVALGLRLLQGIGFAAVAPLVITSIGDLYEGSKEATAQGVRFTGSGIVQSVAPLVSGLLVGLGWQYPFLLYLVAFPIALIVYLRFQEPSTGDPDRPVRAEPRSDPDEAGSFRALLGQRRMQALMLARGLPMLVWIGFLTYNSLIVGALLGGNPAQAGLLAAVGSIAYAGAATQAGRITDVFATRLRPILAGNVLLGGGFVLVLVVPSLSGALVGILITGAGFGILLSLYRSVITGVAPPSHRGGLVSVTEAFGRLVSTLTPVVMGVTIGLVSPVLGFETALRLVGLGAAVLATVGGIGCLLIIDQGPGDAAL
jgi:MFS family permease